MNISPTETPVMEAYTTNAMEGGMTMAMEEALAQGVNPEDLDAIKVSQGVTVQELAEALDVPANDIIKRLFLLGTPLTMTQSMSDDLVELVADDLGRQIKIITPEEENTFSFYDDPADLRGRDGILHGTALHQRYFSAGQHSEKCRNCHNTEPAYLNQQQYYRLPESGPITARILHDQPRNANGGGRCEQRLVKRRNNSGSR